ncbi:MAG: alpha/beta hydrolase-fold protein [Rickettsiaceae bacterium]|nr:alpha/beta hydrolase-fold protein [Rickettsiaceae bacterium]
MNSSKDFLKLPFTSTVNIKSNYNQEDYNLFIRVPNNYGIDNKSYPILVVLDPNFLFSSLYGINSVAQNYIICGIGHDGVDFCDLPQQERSDISEIARSRDFLPFGLDPNIFIEGAPKDLVNRILQCTGKAGDFMLLIKNQIIPFLENNFRTSHNHTILGHSFGGVFVCFALLNYPEIFSNYIAISPILDSRYYVQKEMFGNQYKFPEGRKNNVYIAIGSLEDDVRATNYLQKLEKECRKITDHEQIIGKFELVQGEDHVSVALSGMLRGFRFINNVSKGS